MLRRRIYTSMILIFFMLFIAMGCSNDQKSEIPGDTAADQKPEPPDNIEEKQQLQTDSATFTGRIDNLSIEVMISGVPEDKAYRAFELSEELRNSFDSYGFEAGDQVIFDYLPGKEGSRPMIYAIEKIRN